MVSLETQSRLAHLLKTIAQGEQDIEFSRQSLARNMDFEPYTAFKRIDRHNNAAISAADICEFLRENYISVYDKELRSFLNTHSSTGVRLSFNDFQKVILPKTDNVLRNRAQSRRVTCDDPLPTYVESALARLLQSEIAYLSKVESIREDLSIRYDFGVIDAFELLDLTRANTVNFRSLYNFLNDINCVTTSEVDAILSRFDKNHDEKLNYSEFHDLVQPSSPIYRAALRSTSPKREYRLSSPGRIVSNRARSPRYEADYEYSAKKANADLRYKDYLRSTAKTDYNSEVSVANKSLLNSASSFFRSREASPIRASRYESDLAVSRVRSSRVSSPIRVDRLVSTVSVYTSLVKEKIASISGQTEGFGDLSPKEKKELARFLKGELDLDRSLEKIKKELALQRKYIAENVFKLFDTNGKGYITRGELDVGLKNLEVTATREELYLLWRKIDRNDDGIANFEDFRREVEPVEKVHRSIYADDKDQEEVGLEVRRVLKKLFAKSISNEIACDELRKGVGSRQYFTIFESFNNLKKNFRGWINANSFRDLLTEQGVYNSADDAELLRIRFDRNNNGRVSYAEFVAEVTTKLA